MAEFLDALLPKGSIRWSLHDFPMFTTRDLDHDPVELDVAFEKGTRTLTQFLAPHLEALSSLRLDVTDRRQAALAGWLEFMSGYESHVSLANFVPTRNRKTPFTSPAEAFYLSDGPMYFALERLSEAATIASELRREDIELKIRDDVTSELHGIDDRRGVLPVPLAKQLEAAVTAELVNLGGSFRNTIFDFGDALHDQYDLEASMYQDRSAQLVLA